MTDVVERLREGVNGNAENYRMRQDAADEIERLRKDNDILRQVLGYMKVVSEPETSATADEEQG